MNIEINTRTSFEDIQKQFNSLYPYLKIESLSDESLKKECAGCENCEAATGMCRLHINEEMTIAELEAAMQKHLNRRVQVLRRSGTFWIGTTLTKDWTLEHQNKEGELLSK